MPCKRSENLFGPYISGLLSEKRIKIQQRYPNDALAIGVWSLSCPPPYVPHSIPNIVMYMFSLLSSAQAHVPDTSKTLS